MQWMQCFPASLIRIRISDAYLFTFVSPCGRISITCFCSMYLALFPLDEQTCKLDIASCKHLSVRISPKL